MSVQMIMDSRMAKIGFNPMPLTSDINYIRADHDNISMSEVQHFSDSVYHGITKGDDRIYTSEADTTDKI
mgnify:CR=1 FL=1